MAACLSFSFKVSCFESGRKSLLPPPSPVTQFQMYRETHTVDDVSHINDTDVFEKSLAAKKKQIADLQGRLDELEKVTKDSI